MILTGGMAANAAVSAGTSIGRAVVTEYVKQGLTMAASSYVEKSMTEATNSPLAGFVVGSLTGIATYGTLSEAELEVVNNVKRPQQLGNVGESGIDFVYDIVKGVENGDVPLSNNIQKGNYGEMKMDVYFKSQGYERISLDRVTDLNTPTHHGIDGVYYNPDGHPPYIIGEAKYGSSRLSILADGTPQMSDKWIIDRLENAVGEEIANDIKMEMILNPDNVGSTLVHVSSDGGIDITELIDGIKQ